MSLAFLGIDESKYKADLELLDRYVGFSAELVRISLLGLAAIGFYLKEFVAAKSPDGGPKIETAWFFLLLGLSGLLLAVAVACGLLHRYYATDGIASQLKTIRLFEHDDPEKRAKAPAEALLVAARFRLSRAWLVSCECAAASGIGILGVTFSVRFGVFDSNARWRVAMYTAGSLVTLGAAVSVANWLKTLRRKRADSSADSAQQPPEALHRK